MSKAQKNAGIVLTLLLLTSCWPGGRPASGVDISVRLHQVLSEWGTQDTVTVAGFRLTDGKTSAATAALDEALLSAAAHAGVTVRPDAGIAGAASSAQIKWPADSQLPRDWQQLPGDLLATGLVRTESPWIYLRLALADGGTGVLQHTATIRLAERDLAELVAARQARTSTPVLVRLPDLDIELHILVRRDEGGFPRLVELQEGGQLEEGDRLQLRFRSSQDCEVYAFLYRSDGESSGLHSGPVFADRWIYAPGENSWESLVAGNEVYSLYFLAAHSVEDDKGSMWEDLTQLQTQGRIEKFRGTDLVDAVVVSMLQRTAAGDSVVLTRGRDGIEIGPTERFVYTDGTSFDSKGELFTGQVVARAYSVEVKFR
ncbi:MAG: hypothetical protein O2782_03685 [bacterium]|nr:hypothetical protein [bacterium]